MFDVQSQIDNNKFFIKIALTRKLNIDHMWKICSLEIVLTCKLLIDTASA